MKIQFVNDLHMEFGNPAHLAYNGAEVLCVAGDLTHWAQRFDGLAWLEEQALLYERVFFVLGNHEYYGGKNARDVRRFWETVKLPDNVIVLTGNFHKYQDVIFVGDTLWTDLNGIEQIRFADVMNDNSACYGLTGQRVTQENFHARKDIENAVYVAKHQGLKVVVITHHLPTEAVVAEKWRGSDYNCYFANKYGWAEKLGADVWHFGHTHDTIDVVHEGTRYICNPYGYERYEVNKEYEDPKVIEL